MNKISLTLLRTVFLPVGSPPIGSVCEIKADIGKADIHVEGEQLYCLGEMDIIIDYLSFSANSGRHLFPDQSDTYPGGGGREWQAMINLPFSLNERVDLAANAEYIASLGDLKWFMVAPRALEMEMEIIITEQTVTTSNAQIPYSIRQDDAKRIKDKELKKDGGWQMVSISDMEKDVVEANENISTTTAPKSDIEEQDPTAVITDENINADSVENRGDALAVSADIENISTDIEEDSEMVTGSDINNMDSPVQETMAEGIIEPEMVVDEKQITNASSAAAMAPDDEPEIVKIVFGDGPQPDEKEIQAAIAQAKAEAVSQPTSSAEIDDEPQQTIADVSEDEEAVEAMAPADNTETPKETDQPKKVRRSHGLPRLSVDAQNNTVEISAFNINIKLP